MRIDLDNFDEWVSVRARVGRRHRITNLNRRQAAKNSWKLHRHGLSSSIKRWHKSPAGKQFHRNLSRFNKNKRGRSTTEALDYSLVYPMVCASINEHVSYLICQYEQFDLYNDVYDLLEVMSYIIDSPDIVEDIIDSQLLSSEDSGL